MRRRYLVCYDIRDPRRLRETHKVVVGFGEQLQYSVYLCDLSSIERIHLVDRLKDVVDQRIDSIVFFDLGVADDGHARIVESLGPRAPLPDSGARIV